MAEAISSRPKPLVLLVLDGVGVAPAGPGNAWTNAKTPNLDELMASFFVTTLQASSEAVGLPYGEIGNSEVGHLAIGTGRIMYQNLPRISRAILDGTFFTNEALLSAIKHVNEHGGTLHLVGMMSSAGVHSYNEHGYALLELAKQQGVKRVAIDVILDGRDALYNSGAGFVVELEQKITALGVGRITTVMGRFYAMDRDNRWERTEAAYRAIAEGQGAVFSDAASAIAASYEQKKYDEEMIPTVIGEHTPLTDSDAVILFNFRPDRMRQLTKALALPTFMKFTRAHDPRGLEVITMTEYEKDLPVRVAFPPEDAKYPLAGVLSKAGLKQLHLAETEKYAHVTFFLNGGQEESFPGEDREIIPSPRVESYAEVPAMSVEAIAKRIIQEIDRGFYDVIIANFANGDMVAHTGDLKATIRAMEIMDVEIGKITDHVLKQRGVLVITADHGNAEELIKSTNGMINKEHSVNPVPFILVGAAWAHQPKAVALTAITPSGLLADVAPTVLKILGLEPSQEMTGIALIE